MSATSWAFALLLLCAVVLLYCYGKIGRLIRCVLFTSLTGLGSLGLVLLLGNMLPLPLDITPFSVLCSGILGIPGVIGMLIFRLI